MQVQIIIIMSINLIIIIISTSFKKAMLHI